MNQTALFYAARQGHAETIEVPAEQRRRPQCGGHQWGNGAAGLPIEFVLFFIFFFGGRMVDKIS